MIKKLFTWIILITLFLISCGQQNTENKIQKISNVIENVAKKHNVILTSKIFLTTEKTNSLTITVHTPLKHKATVGNILMDCYLKLAEQNILFKRYILTNKLGEVGMDISKKNLENSIKCMPVAIKTIKALANNNIDDIVSDLDSTQFTTENVEKLKKYVAEKLNGKVLDLGFETHSFNGSTYCIYQAFIDTTFVNVSINITASKCKIYGMNF